MTAPPAPVVQDVPTTPGTFVLAPATPTRSAVTVDVDASWATHVLVTGPDGGSRTSVALDMAAQAHAKGWDVLVCNLTLGYRQARYPVIADVTTVSRAADAASALAAIAPDDTTPPRPVLIVVDEATVTPQVWQPPAGQAAHDRVTVELERLARTGRTVGVHLVAITDDPAAGRLLPAWTDLLGVRLHLGRSTSEAREAVFGPVEVEGAEPWTSWAPDIGYLQARPGAVPRLVTVNPSEAARPAHVDAASIVLIHGGAPTRMSA